MVQNYYMTVREIDGVTYLKERKQDIFSFIGLKNIVTENGLFSFYTTYKYVRYVFSF